MSDEDGGNDIEKARRRRQRPRPEGGPRQENRGKKRYGGIPRLPSDSDVPTLDAVKKIIQGEPGASTRAAAVLAMREKGVPWERIADHLDYASVSSAKKEYYKALAATAPEEDHERERALAMRRAERLFERSVAMASADFLIDDRNGERVPNADRTRWHEIAGRDLDRLVMISGAKAPAKIEVTPDMERFEELAQRMAAAAGATETHELDVLELEVIPDAPPEED